MALEHIQMRSVYDMFEDGDTVEITSLAVNFPIADAYEDVTFGDEEKNEL